jgi:hypothetical protein
MGQLSGWSRFFDETLRTKESSLRNLGAFVVGVKVGTRLLTVGALALNMGAGLEGV